MISKSQPKPTQLQSLFNVFYDNNHYETFNVLPLPPTTASVLSWYLRPPASYPGASRRWSQRKEDHGKALKAQRQMGRQGLLALRPRLPPKIPRSAWELGIPKGPTVKRFLQQSGISLNLRTGSTGYATLFNQWEGALVFINKQIKTSPQWSKIFKTTDGVGQN